MIGDQLLVTSDQLPATVSTQQSPTSFVALIRIGVAEFFFSVLLLHQSSSRF